MVHALNGLTPDGRFYAYEKKHGTVDVCDMTRKLIVHTIEFQSSREGKALHFLDNDRFLWILNRGRHDVAGSGQAA